MSGCSRMIIQSERGKEKFNHEWTPINTNGDGLYSSSPPNHRGNLLAKLICVHSWLNPSR